MPLPIVSPMTMKRIRREVADLKKEDLGGMTLAPSEESLFLWRGTIPGPEGSVYEGGVFKVDVSLAQDYPFSAPKVVFKTRIYHMNISDRGDICIDILKQNWSPALSLFKVMLSLSSLLTDPNPRDPLVSSIANQFITNRRQHDLTARHWTDIYARPQPPPPPPPSIPTEQSAKARGKAKVVESRSVAATPSSSAVRNTPIFTGEPIEIEDSDEEEEATRSRVLRNSGTKRKREDLTRDSSTGGDELEGSRALSNKRAALDVQGVSDIGSSRRGAPISSNEVIVIEDD